MNDTASVLIFHDFDLSAQFLFELITSAGDFLFIVCVFLQ